MATQKLLHTLELVAAMGNRDDAAASGAVTDTDTAMAYLKQLITEAIARDGVIGTKATAAAEGAVTGTDLLMAYVKQLVTLGIARDGVIGAVNSAAATGAVTDSDLLMAYIKQLVTEGIARDAVIGALTDAADSTPNTATAMNLLRAILAACGDLEGTDILARLGALTDVAADTTDTATMIALLRQIVEAVNNGTGSAIGSNLSLVDIIGAFDGGADPQGDIYQALGVDTTNSVKALIDAVQAVAGALTDAAAEGAVTETDTIMQYVKQLVTEGIARDAVIGALDTAAAEGAVTDADLLMAYIKQLVTEGIARDGVVGALADAAAEGAVTEADTIMAYIKQLVTEGIARDGVVGALDDAAAEGAVTDADTAMAYIKQLVTEGIARDAAIASLLPAIVYKTVAFDGGAGSGGIGTVALFTVTGAAKFKLYAICTETLVGAATLSCGTAGEPVGIIAQIADATQLAVGEIWWDGTPTTLLDDDANIPIKVIGDGADIILTIAAAAITDGTIAFRAEWQPVTSGSTLVAA